MKLAQRTTTFSAEMTNAILHFGRLADPSTEYLNNIQATKACAQAHLPHQHHQLTSYSLPWPHLPVVASPKPAQISVFTSKWQDAACPRKPYTSPNAFKSLCACTTSVPPASSAFILQPSQDIFVTIPLPDQMPSKSRVHAPRTRVPFFSVAHLSRGTLPQKKGEKGHY